MFEPIKPPDLSFNHPVWGRLEARNAPAAVLSFALAALMVCGGIRLLRQPASRELVK